MGELIRNLHEIHIGNETLMVELNEGYNKRQGRLIHIQNKSFRYLLKEKEYLQLATSVLRAKKEKDSYRFTEAKKRSAVKANVYFPCDEKTLKVTDSFCALLEEKNIDYRLVDCGRNYLSVIVNNKDYSAFSKCMKKSKAFKKKEHIYGEKYGYKFIYQVRPFEMFLSEGVVAEVFFQLPCLSLTPKMWLPLDSCIQKRVWECQEEKEGKKVLDLISAYIYRLCFCIFNKSCFNGNDISFFEKNKSVLGEEEFVKCLSKVFFGYSARLCELIDTGKYDEVIYDYFSDNNY